MRNIWLLNHVNYSGTNKGDVRILNSSNMKVHTVVKKAHLGPVTSLAFSNDSRFVYVFYLFIYLFIISVF